MTKDEALLLKVAEECIEVAHRVHKAMRFGMTEVQSGQQMNNRERIEDELYDLTAALEESGIILDNFDEERYKAKQERLRKYLAYSVEQGTVTA